jgi:hypothetical protein
MAIEKFSGFGPPEGPPPASEEEKVIRPGEKLEGFYKQLWERASKVMSALDLDLESKANLEKGKELEGKIEEIKKLEKDDDHKDEYLFLETELQTDEGRLTLRMPAQIDKDYDPYKLIDYDEGNPGYEAESKRWLGREIMMLEKLNRFCEGEPILADTLIKANRNKASDEFFLLKKTEIGDKPPEEFGEAEGRALAETLLGLQYRVNATGLIKEIMAEEKLKTKYELENNVTEDYFDDKQGYLDNVKGEMKGLPKDLRKQAWAEMKKQLEVVDMDQLEDGQYSLAHGNCKFDNLVYKDKKILLADWKRPGTTLNKQLSIVYDLSDVYMDAIENIEDPEQAKAFLKGIEDRLRQEYQGKQFGRKDKTVSGAAMAEAVIKLTKLRAYSMIDRENLVKQELTG